MSQQNRLPLGGQIDRNKPLRFWYDDVAYQGFAGDTLASALLANGITLMARSFKYHRPRGVFSAGSEEPNALVQLETGAHTEPNRRATEIELYEGLTAKSQNCWPSVKFDVGAINAKAARLLPAGFYYKTFMWPGKLWMTYEKYIRKAAGLGVAPQEIDPDSYDKQHAYCDVLIVGAGPSGLSAALAAGRAGMNVMLIDEGVYAGGALQADTATINNQECRQWVEQVTAELTELDNVTYIPRTTVTGYYDHNFLVAVERISEHLGPKKSTSKPRERLWKIRASKVILATGAIERPLVFADNDRPGIMLCSALRHYIHRYGVLPGKRIVIICNNDSAYQTAIDAKNAGATVQVVDIRKGPDGDLVDQVRAMDIRIHDNSTITGVDYRSGQLQGVEIMQLSEDGEDVMGSAHSLSCDSVGNAGGWTPTVHLFSQSRGKLRYDDNMHCFLPDQNSPTNNSVSIGACNGENTLLDCLSHGFAAGIAAATELADGEVSVETPEFMVNTPRYGTMRPMWILPCDHPIGQGKKKHFHELHNDSTIADLELANREGFISIEHTKRYTTTGMGTDQGKTSNVNALTTMAKLRKQTIPEVGTTTFRPPYTPLTFGAIVGHDRRELFVQKRKTAINPWHEERGAIFEDVGDWKRPWYFPRSGEDMHQAVQRETKAVRDSAGVLDASTLGKIDIRGADAAWLLDILYTNAWGKLAPGRCRYGVMLNEHGMVFDDGVTTCIAENHYHMTTTTGGAARVLSWIEEWLQTEWPEKQVYCTSVTEQWAVCSLNGPMARAILGKLTDLDLSNDAFPFMSMQAANVAGIPARIYRISFTGELAYEINVPARFGLALWKAVMEAGDEYQITPYGTEAMHVLRAEKGFIIVGQDTDGTMTPFDLDMEWIVSKKKDDFLGKRSLSRSDTGREGRKQLVGLLTDDANFVLPEGSHVVEELKEAPPMKMLGHITSSYHSPNLGRSIAMALIAGGLQRSGEKVTIALVDGSHQQATITSPVFFDPTGERRNG